MLKVIVMLFISLLSLNFVYLQTRVDSDCNSNIEKIFKVLNLKIKYEAIQSFYTDSIIYKKFGKSEENRRSYEKEIKVFNPNNCTPEEAFIAYRDFIRNIKSEKEKYLKCIDAEIAKGDSSDYTNKLLSLYNYLPLWQSNGLVSVTKLNFLKIFKEFIFNKDEEVLPECFRIRSYIQGNCKTRP